MVIIELIQQGKTHIQVLADDRHFRTVAVFLLDQEDVCTCDDEEV